MKANKVAIIDVYENGIFIRKLESVWPQYAKTVIRFNRPHHLIDWKQFKNKS